MGAHMLCAFGRQQSASSIIPQELVTLILLLAYAWVWCAMTQEWRSEDNFQSPAIVWVLRHGRKCHALPVAVPLTFVWRQSLIVVELVE